MNNMQKSILRWILNIQEFDFTPKHRTGRQHQNVDALSRMQTS